MNEVITNPRLLFPLYLVLTNTFLITTHYPTESIEKYENAEMWMTLVSVILMNRLVQNGAIQQQYYLQTNQQVQQEEDVFLNEYSDVDSDDSEEVIG